MPKESTEKETPKKQPFRNFVMKAGKTKDKMPTDLDPDGLNQGDEYQSEPSEMLNQKIIAGLYRICSRPKFHDQDIKDYLDKHGYEITDEQIIRLKGIRGLTSELFECGKY